PAAHWQAAAPDKDRPWMALRRSRMGRLHQRSRFRRRRAPRGWPMPPSRSPALVTAQPPPAGPAFPDSQPVRMDREIGGIALLSLAKMVRQVFRAQSFEIQRDSDPVGRAAAEVAVQL